MHLVNIIHTSEMHGPVYTTWRFLWTSNSRFSLNGIDFGCRIIVEWRFGHPHGGWKWYENLRLGSISFYGPPNEDFGRLNKALRMRFWTRFQSIVAQNYYSHPWKELQKAHATLCSAVQYLRLVSIKFMLPKRGFGNVEKYVGKTFCNHFYTLKDSVWDKSDEKSAEP